MPERKSSRKPGWQIDIVKERISILFGQAADSLDEHPDRSRRYVSMAVKLSMRYNARLSPEQKASFCKSCHTPLVPGRTSSVRTSPSRKSVITTCKHCGHVSRRPYRREAK
jgi:ribonuclease P protein subunit RPR2